MQWILCCCTDEIVQGVKPVAWEGDGWEVWVGACIPLELSLVHLSLTEAWLPLRGCMGKIKKTFLAMKVSVLPSALLSSVLGQPSPCPLFH